MTKNIQKLIEKHFETAFSAPEGIKKLRELILTLAMQGKLVPQDPNDQPASELLKQIQTEKQKLIKQGKIKKNKPLPPISPDEIPYDLPNGWEWVRLGGITEYNGREKVTPSDINPDTWVLELEDIEKETSRLLKICTYVQRNSKSTKSRFIKGDVLYGKLRPYLDKVIVAEDTGVCTTEIVPIVPYGNIDSYFLRLLLKRPSFIRDVTYLSYGVKMPRLGTTDAINTLHPLPPLAEQHRIVKKIDQLMTLCDELEKLRSEQDEKHKAVHASAIHHLLEAKDKKTFNTSWTFINRHFDTLYAHPENITELRKSILQLAVMGKLVPQDTNDQPASELLKQIQAEKQKLIKQGKIKKSKPLPPISPDEIPYDLPNGWEWIRLGNIFPDFQNGISKRNSSSGIEAPVIRLADVTNQEIDLTNLRYIKLSSKEVQKYELKQKDVLITRVNGSIDLVGSFTPVRNTHNLAYCDHFIRLRISHRHTNYEYLCLVGSCRLLRRQIESKFVSTAGQKTINQGHISTVILPLPPLAEQHRIVKKVDQLMTLCDELEKQTQTATEKQTALLNALMAQI